jgi:AAA15 family ATPase/GTPase
MLIEFSVQNFGSIKNKQTLSFEATKDEHLAKYYIIPTKVKNLKLLKLGLIYGANASGKTTVLQALNFLRNIVLRPKREKDMPFTYEPFLFDKKTPDKNTIFNISFIQNDIRYDYEVEMNKKSIVREKLDFYNPNKALVFTRTTDTKKQYTDSIVFGGKIKKNKNAETVLKDNTLWNNTVIGGFAKTNIENNELKNVRDWFSSYLNEIIYTKTGLSSYTTKNIEKESSSSYKNDIIEILRAADFDISNFAIETKKVELPPNIVDILEFIKKKNIKGAANSANKISFAPNIFSERKVTFEHLINEDRYELSLNKESQGTQRYYGLAGILLTLMRGTAMFIIDELENSLHPDLFIHFLLSFLVNSKKSQIIATTHNREILNNKDIFRNDAIWITNKDKESATQLYSLSEFGSSIIRDSTNVYNAYKTGKLGGIPNLSNYYIGAE